jgi:hypothetical protein
MPCAAVVSQNISAWLAATAGTLLWEQPFLCFMQFFWLPALAVVG